MALSPDQAISFVALNRFGLGAKPGTDLASLTADPRGFLKQELDQKSEIINAPGLLDTKSGLQALFEHQRAEKMMREQMPASKGQSVASMAATPQPTVAAPQNGMQAGNGQSANAMSDKDMAAKDMKPAQIPRDTNLNESMARFLQAYAATTGFAA